MAHLRDRFEQVDEIQEPRPIDPTREQTRQSVEQAHSQATHHSSNGDGDYQPPSSATQGKPSGLDEIDVAPALHDVEAPTSSRSSPSDAEKHNASQQHNDLAPCLLKQLYTLSYLIFFSFLGTLARLGLQSLTSYPGAPTDLGILWANFAGCVIMGFLVEDQALFREDWDEKPTPSQPNGVANTGGGTTQSNASEQKKRHAATKKKKKKKKKGIPLYIGVSTGFCGSFTSFSSFIRDAFLALSNDVPAPAYHVGVSSADALAGRGDGYSVLAVLAVLILTVCFSLSAISFGSHLALWLSSSGVVPSLSIGFVPQILDPLIVLLALGCWLAAVLLAFLPPNTAWRGDAIFALVFAPPGCLLRFFLAITLNSKIASFPLGTFAANVGGTVVLGAIFDIQHSGIGGATGCQLLQGIQDGFCGCLTTVSTWAVELKALRRRHAYIYGSVSVAVSWAFLVVIMGSLKWTEGFKIRSCHT